MSKDNNKIVERITDIEVMSALDSLKSYVEKTKLYYQTNRTNMYNDILFDDILQSYKCLVRGLDRIELEKIKV